ncbi:MAG: MtrB/PioB family decaheme-associated outer membrane protein [Burkholderiales bacterium]
MKNQRNVPVRSAIVIALALAFPAGYAFADEVQALTSPNQSDVSLNIRNIDQVNPYFRLYNGQDKTGVTGSVDINLIKRDANGMWFTVQGKDLGQRNQEFGASAEQQGDWRLALDYNEITRFAPYTINTKVAGVGTASLALNTDFRSYQGIGPDSSLKLERIGTSVSGSKYFSDAFKFNFSMKSEDKKGAIMSAAYGATWNTPVGAPYAGKNYASVFFAPQPENYRHNQFEASFDYVTRKLQLSGGVYLSVLDNSAIAMNTTPGQNSLTTTTGPITSPWISLPPSNRATQWDFSGAYNYSDQTRMSFKLAKETGTQDTPFIAAYGDAVTGSATYTKLNPPGVPYAAGNVATSLGGLVETTSAFGQLTSKLGKDLNFLASWRYEDRSDKTPQLYYLDKTASTEYPTGYQNPQESHTLNRGKAELTYRLPDGYSMTGGYDYERKVTPRAYRAEVTDQTVRVELRKALSDTLNGKFMIAHSDRTGGTWELLDGTPTPGMVTFSTTTGVAAPLQFADRKRDKAKLMMDWSPVDPLSLQFFYEYGKDAYPFTPPSGNAQMGMTDGRTDLIGIDAAFQINDKWKMNGYYSRNQNTTHQNEVYTPRMTADQNCTGTLATNSCTPWMADLDMSGQVFGMGLSGSVASWTMSAKYLYSQDTTKYGITFNPAGPSAAGSSVPAGAGVLPDTVYSINRLNLSGGYAVSKQTKVRLDYVYDVRKMDDYTWSQWTFTDGTRVMVSPTQTTQLLGVTLTHSY